MSHKQHAKNPGNGDKQIQILWDFLRCLTQCSFFREYYFTIEKSQNLPRDTISCVGSTTQQSEENQQTTLHRWQRKKVNQRHTVCKLGCNTFTPQIKGIPEDTKATYTSPQGCISMYTSVH